ncbi:MAG: glycosyltransferase [Ignavibacteria bacterium]|nr:glycosyltransferase [Ignavibacteria bacterium]
MNKVLIISYYFPPMGMGGVQRTLKFAKYLKDYGWQPVVITDSPKKYFAVDNSLLEEAIESGIKIERTGNKPFDPSKIIVKAPKENMRKLRSAVSQFFFIPDSKIGWKKKALKKIDEIWSKYNGFDLVFATAPPYTDFLIGQEVKRKYKIPLVIDYRDAWVDSPVLNYYPTPYHKLKNMRLEKGVLKIANKVITTNRRVKEYIISRYGNIEYNDVKIISHGFDSEDFEKAAHSELPSTSKFRVSYSGSFYTRNPKFYFEAIKAFVDKYPELKNDIEFCFIGTFSKENLQIAKNLGIEQYLNITGYLEHINCVKYVMASDVLFLMISRGENEDAAMPGKVGEYIGSRKNIIACIPEGVTKKMLEKYNAIKFIDDESPEQIARAIKEYYDEKKNGTMPMANEEMLEEYDRKNLTYELAKEFNLLKDID